MGTIISGILSVPSFTQTGTPGEYTFEGATYNTQTDSSGNAAYGLHTDMVLYVPASDLNTLMPIGGVTHRYKITEITVVDAGTINAKMVWDEQGDEVDMPTNGTVCIITEVTPNKKLGYAIAQDLYPELDSNVASGASNSDLINIIDKQEAPGVPTAYIHTQATAGKVWNIQHNKKSINFVYTIFDDMQTQCLPNSVVVVDENQLLIYMLEDMQGRAIFSFV